MCVAANLQKNMQERNQTMRYILRVPVKKKWPLVRGANSLNKERKKELLLLGHDLGQYVNVVFIL